MVACMPLSRLSPDDAASPATTGEKAQAASEMSAMVANAALGLNMGRPGAINSPVFKGKNLWTNTGSRNGTPRGLGAPRGAAALEAELERVTKHLEQKKKETTSLRHRLVRRGYLLDTIRKSYLRDVVDVAEELRRKEKQGTDYVPDPALDSMPHLDLKQCLLLFDPQEVAMNIKPCSVCGGTMEMIHLETAKIAKMQKVIDRLEKSETELKAEVDNTKALLLREQDRVTNEQQLAKQEQSYFLKEIGKLKHQIQEDDAPGLRAQLRIFERTKKELAEALSQVRELDRTKFLLKEANESIDALKEEVAGHKETIEKDRREKLALTRSNEKL